MGKIKVLLADDFELETGNDISPAQEQHDREVAEREWELSKFEDSELIEELERRLSGTIPF